MADDALNASPESFHDANQTIISPSDPPSGPGATTTVRGQVNPNLGATIAAMEGNSSGDSWTPSPIQQRRLMFSSDENSTRNNNQQLTGASGYLRNNSEPGQESLNMRHVHEEEEEEGDGDSIIEAVEFDELDECLDESIRDRLQCLVKDEGPEVLDCDANRCLLKKGLSPEVSVPTVPVDWEPAIAKTEKGEPTFLDVDNPGKWSEFTYRPRFEKTGEKKYVHHVLPTGAKPVPVNAEGKRIVDGWEFHYDKWISEAAANEKNRSGATSTAPFPESRKGRLDYDLLKKMKLTKKRLVEGDALFFLQLLLPIGDPKKSGIENDPRMPYYSEVERWTQKYATSLGLGGSYGHSFKEAMLDELLHFDSAVIRDGVHGGTDGAIYRRWKLGETTFDPEIARSITHTRWLQLKRTYKLCDNETAPKKGEEGYDPAYKFDYIFKCVINNVNELSYSADLDLCGDETTWAHNGFGEAGTGLLTRVMGKPGVTKGGQIVLLADAYRNRPRAYLHRHKCHQPIEGFTRQGPLEVRMIMEDLKWLVKDGESDGRRQIFMEKPHSTWDNFFSGDDINNWIGLNGFGTTMTCRRDRLPKGLPNYFFHKISTAPGDKKARVARFNNPITVVKHVSMTPAPAAQGTEGQPATPPIKYTKVHVTFQSTSSCNITTVNALNQNSLFVVQKQRGSGVQKRKWVIEMNDARQLYLATYGRIDTIDSLINKCNMYYCCWKYWHSAKNHGLALAVVTAYGMYKECVTETLAKEAFGIARDEVKLLSFHDFRDKLSGQGLAYTPLNTIYPGDSAMRAVTRMTSAQQKQAYNGGKEKRPVGRPKKTRIDDEALPVVTPRQLKVAKRHKLKSRLCGDLTAIDHHILSKVTKKHSRKCAFCGEDAYTFCTICPGEPALHFYPTKGDGKGRGCFMDYHSDACFGLARADLPVLLGKRTSDWSPPSANEKKKNAKHINSILADEAEGTGH